jgi:hypothetical protein
MWFLPPLFNMDLRKEHIRNMNHAETPGETWVRMMNPEWKEKNDQCGSASQPLMKEMHCFVSQRVAADTHSHVQR